MALIKREDAKREIYTLGKNPSINSIWECLDALPSAEAESTVIRSKTLLPTKDFKEWAKRIRETNPNAVVIPCDAEVVSADTVQGEWILVKGSNGKDYHKCSKCLHTQEITGVKNYCAVCGARMKGGDSE